MDIKLHSPESVGMSTTRLDRIKHAMSERLDKSELIGLSTMISRQGKTVYFEQQGFSRKEDNKLMSPDSLFRLYSMTKPMICVAFMTLFEQGKFDLFGPVSEYIPAFSDLKVLEKDEHGQDKLVSLSQPVAIHHLLTHTSGLVYDFYDDSPVCQLYRDHQVSYNSDRSLQEFVDVLCTLPLAFQPAEKYLYSVSIDVVGRLIEIIAEKPLSQFLKETIFEPLAMMDTGFSVPDHKLDRLASLYGPVDALGKNLGWKEFINAPAADLDKLLDVSKTHRDEDPYFVRGGLGLIGSAPDYMRFAQMMLNGGELDGKRILSPKTLELMHMNHLNQRLLPIGFGEFKLRGYGFGLGSRVLVNVAESLMPGSLGEYGWSGAAKTYYWVDPKEELIGLFMTQSMGNWTLVQRQFQSLVYQAITSSFV